MQIRASIIGCGKRGKAHAVGYDTASDTTFVGFADPVNDAACALAADFGDAPVFVDHREMLAETSPNMVSVCTWPQYRIGIIRDCVEAGVKAIHCEKPMALSWGDSRRMHDICRDAGVQLSFCHQRRYVTQYVRALELIREGALGTVQQLQGHCANFFDWGTHWFDMFHYFNDESPAQWVLGQVDTTGEKTVFAAPVDTGGVSQLRFENGVLATLITGKAAPKGAGVRVIGDAGVLEVCDWTPDGPIRLLRDGGTGRWERPEIEPEGKDPGTPRSILDAIAAFREGRPLMCSSEHALRATQLIFATFLSAQRGGRIDLPLSDEELPMADFFPAAAASA